MKDILNQEPKNKTDYTRYTTPGASRWSCEGVTTEIGRIKRFQSWGAVEIFPWHMPGDILDRYMLKMKDGTWRIAHRSGNPMSVWCDESRAYEGRTGKEAMLDFMIDIQSQKVAGLEAALDEKRGELQALRGQLAELQKEEVKVE